MRLRAAFESSAAAPPDLADLRGQNHAKRARTIALAAFKAC